MHIKSQEHLQETFFITTKDSKLVARVPSPSEYVTMPLCFVNNVMIGTSLRKVHISMKRQKRVDQALE